MVSEFVRRTYSEAARWRLLQFPYVLIIVPSGELSGVSVNQDQEFQERKAYRPIRS